MRIRHYFHMNGGGSGSVVTPASSSSSSSKSASYDLTKKPKESVVVGFENDGYVMPIGVREKKYIPTFCVGDLFYDWLRALKKGFKGMGLNLGAEMI